MDLKWQRSTRYQKVSSSAVRHRSLPSLVSAKCPVCGQERGVSYNVEEEVYVIPGHMNRKDTRSCWGGGIKVDLVAIPRRREYGAQAGGGSS